MSDGGTALVSAGVSLFIGVVTVAASLFVARQQAKQAVEVARQQAKQAVELKREDLRTEYMAEAAIRRLLIHPEWEKRSFGAIRQRLGDGFTDTELRKLLVRAGAVRLPDKDKKDLELWGLAERNEDELD
ncbi:hypothetical protein ACFWOJ_18945 [Streptomyces sp. NPDC058439]|uniref:hypothetical protein n=1 Tax=Streptomyces sp. NPDC058439 TaxID=3346500 RepID=UPI00365080C9